MVSTTPQFTTYSIRLGDLFIKVGEALNDPEKLKALRERVGDQGLTELLLKVRSIGNVMDIDWTK